MNVIFEVKPEYRRQLSGLSSPLRFLIPEVGITRELYDDYVEHCVSRAIGT